MRFLAHVFKDSKGNTLIQVVIAAGIMGILFVLQEERSQDTFQSPQPSTQAMVVTEALPSPIVKDVKSSQTHPPDAIMSIPRANGTIGVGDLTGTKVDG